MDEQYAFFARVPEIIRDRIIKHGLNPQKPVKQHFVPTSHQARFRGNGGALWAYLFPLKRIVDAHPSRIGRIPDLYTLPDENGNPDYQVEHFFAAIEDLSAPVIERLLNGDELTEEDRFWLCYFLGISFCRSNDLIRSYQSLYAELHIRDLRGRYSSLESTRRELEKYPNPGEITAEELFDFVHSDEYDIVYENHTVVPDILKLIPGICQLFWKSRLTIIHAPEGKSFITGDSPVVLLKTLAREPMGFMRAIRVAPLSSDVCLISTPRMSGIERNVANRDQVRNVNLLVASSAYEFILGRSDALISSLVRATGVERRVWEPVFSVGQHLSQK
ncbi:DUF4238 domain-containing protein [Ralstonia pseudosolanacearum]|uniref:DUF4238 domain-containing protein n=1 Tax=Ralstonia pseudosolanacearum TaxID=1310165 RepID=UPI0026759DD9|nr:DUF4238 domain-containing protein [Ralstonia pseudosolanacearum]MDO3624459.1 DUF4238 domain-containing protein [Ralstonia pseudosolanacearum]